MQQDLEYEQQQSMRQPLLEKGKQYSSGRSSAAKRPSKPSTLYTVCPYILGGLSMSKKICIPVVHADESHATTQGTSSVRDWLTMGKRVFNARLIFESCPRAQSCLVHSQSGHEPRYIHHRRDWRKPRICSNSGGLHGAMGMLTRVLNPGT